MTRRTDEPRKTPTRASWLAEDGADAIFITGAPGSKWSIVAYALSIADEINTSDMADHRSYGTPGTAFHFGNYFGPGMEYGERFDKLDTLPKSRLLKELSAPYARPGGLKVLKSHMFARHIDYLVGQFPRARFVLVYRTERACLDWWLDAGGFDISFPDYSWYRELSNMKEHVAIDNRGIETFVEKRQLRLKRLRSFRPVLEALELHWSRERLAALDVKALGIPPDDPEAAAQALHTRASEVKIATFWADRL